MHSAYAFVLINWFDAIFLEETVICRKCSDVFVKVSNLPRLGYWDCSYISQILSNNRSVIFIQETVELCPLKHNLLVQGGVLTTIFLLLCSFSLMLLMGH